MVAETPATSHAELDASLLRIGLLSAGLIFFGVAFGLWQDQTFTSPLNLTLSFAAWAGGAVTIILAFVRAPQRRWSWLILVSSVVLSLQSAYSGTQTYSPLLANHSDNEMIAKYAVEALKDGQNPYSWNFTDMLRVYRDRGDITPLLDGSSQNRVTYPALPTLTLWLLDKIGLGQVRTLGLIAWLILLCLIFISCPEPARPVILLPLLLLKWLMALSLGGLQDVVWCTLLVGMILAWQHPTKGRGTLRAILFGLAISYRQQPWFIAPFLLVILWNEPGSVAQRLRRIAYFIGMSAGVFLIINLPFMLWNFRDWWLGTFEPAYAPFSLFSQGGLADLSVFGIAALPREFYSVAQVSFYVVALVIHARHPRFVGQAFWIFPGIFFWLYYRSLSNYWIYWLPPLLVALIHWRSVTRMTAANPARRVALSAIVALTITAINVLLAAYYLRLSPAIAVSYRLPLRTSADGQVIEQISLSVTNSSIGVFRPRFAVQYDPGSQALPWTILSGSESLGPGESGAYLISAEGVLGTGLPTNTDGQIVVTDADGNYLLRGLCTVAAGAARTNPAAPDLIANPDFALWPIGSGLPQDWNADLAKDVTVSTGLSVVDGRNSLSLHVVNASEDSTAALTPVKLTQQTTFPGPLSIWVYPTLAAVQPEKAVYGLEIDDGIHRLRVLFGESDLHGQAGGVAFVYLRAPLNQWSEQKVDLTQLYGLFGWPLPDYSIRYSGGLQYAARQIQFSLIAGSSLSPETDWTFGPIQQADDFASPDSPDQRVAEALAHPDDYYTNLGDLYRTQRNYSLAQNAYLSALGFDGANASSYFGLGESRLALNNRQAAIDAFEKAIALGYSQPDLARARIMAARAQTSP